MKYYLIIILIQFPFFLKAQSKVVDSKQTSLTKIQKENHLKDEIGAIKDNFNRINSIKEWTKITTYETDDSTEGGFINYYYLNEILEKILVRKFGESGQYLAEYYFANNNLSFVYEKDTKYNAPLYWKEYDAKKDESDEKRFYLYDEQLIQVIHDKKIVRNDSSFIKQKNTLYSDLKEILKWSKMAKEGINN